MTVWKCKTTSNKFGLIEKLNVSQGNPSGWTLERLYYDPRYFASLPTRSTLHSASVTVQICMRNVHRWYTSGRHRQSHKKVRRATPSAFTFQGIIYFFQLHVKFGLKYLTASWESKKFSRDALTSIRYTVAVRTYGRTPPSINLQPRSSQHPSNTVLLPFTSKLLPAEWK